jgi:hypothetical protein
MSDKGPGDSGFVAPPDVSQSEPGDLAPAPEIVSNAEYISAEVEALKIKRWILAGRAIAGAAAFVLGGVIVGSVAWIALESIAKSWAERTQFGDVGHAERLKYLVAFFTFKAAALGGSLTAGLLLIRASNRLSGGRRGDDSEGVELPPDQDDD